MKRNVKYRKNIKEEKRKKSILDEKKIETYKKDRLLL